MTQVGDPGRPPRMASSPPAQSQPLHAAHQFTVAYDRWKRALLSATGASANITGGKFDPSSPDDGFDADGLIDSLSMDALKAHLKGLVAPAQKLVSALGLYACQQQQASVPGADAIASAPALPENTSSSSALFPVHGLDATSSTTASSSTASPGRPAPLGHHTSFGAHVSASPTTIAIHHNTSFGNTSGSSFVTIFNHLANKHHDRLARPGSSTSLALRGAGGHRQSLSSDTVAPRAPRATASKTSPTKNWETGSSMSYGMTAAIYAGLELSLVGHTEPKNDFQRTRTANVGAKEEDDPWELNQYLVLELLGQGSQGSVYLGFDNEKNEFRAVKEIKRPLARSAAMQQIRSEVDIMKRLRHRNLITLYELIDDPQHQYMYLVMRYAEKGILVQYTSDDQTTNETVELSKVSYYAKQLTAALAYLHCHEIYHRDIKPENVLCGKDDEVYLADFGVAQMLEGVHLEGSCGSWSPGASLTSLPKTQGGPSVAGPTGGRVQQQEQSPPTVQMDACSAGTREDVTNETSTFTSTRGTPAYFAPELAAGEIAECDLNLAAVDVWALGVTIYQLLCGKLPFSASELTNYAKTPNRAKQIEKEASLEEVGKKNSASLSGSQCLLGGMAEMRLSQSRNSAFDHSVNYLDNLLQDDICPIPAHVPKEWEKILRGMLNKNPKKRMTVPEVRARLKAMDTKKTQPVPSLRRNQPSGPPPIKGDVTIGDVKASEATDKKSDGGPFLTVLSPKPPTVVSPTDPNPRRSSADSSTRNSSVAITFSETGSDFSDLHSDSYSSYSSGSDEPEPPTLLGAAAPAEGEKLSPASALQPPVLPRSASAREKLRRSSQRITRTSS